MSTNKPANALVQSLREALDWLTDYAIDIDGDDEAHLAQIRATIEDAIGAIAEAQPLLLTALAAFNEQPRFKIRWTMRTSYEVATLIERWRDRYALPVDDH